MSTLQPACNSSAWAKVQRYDNCLFQTPSIPPSAGPRFLSSATHAGDASARDSLEKVQEALVTERCLTFEDCIAWARRKFQVRHTG